MKVEIPSNCPSCGSLLERVKDQLFCRNLSCGDKQVKQVVNYAKVMKIKGLGEQTIRKLSLENIKDIYELTLSSASAEIGEKLATKLIDEIEKSKVTTLDKFVAACSIPLIGMTAGKKLLSVASNPYNITVENCKKAGLGDKATSNLLYWFTTEYLGKLEELPLQFTKSKIPEKNIENTYIVCITGKIPGYTKAKLAEYLSGFGVTVVDNVSKKTNYLLCDESKNSIKERRAIELGIKVLNLENLIKEINNNV